jgi:hypothetical protein
MQVIQADASPEKWLFLEMFTRDLSLEDCVLDLIDNSIDSLIRTRGIDVSDALLEVSTGEGSPSSNRNITELGVIEIKYNSKEFVLNDKCGGISEEVAEKEVFRFGHKPGALPGQLGVYGIGLKRAIFKIGNDIIIESKTELTGFRTQINVPMWADEPEWKLPLEITAAAEGTGTAGTKIRISELRQEVSELFKSEAFQKQLNDMVARTYCLFLDKYVQVTINDHKVDPIPIPLGSSDNVNVAKEMFNHEDVTVTLYAALAARDKEGEWKAENAGWYAACNGRFVVLADKTDLTGWGSTATGIFVPKYRGFVGIAFFFSKNPLSLPWTTMKRGLNRESLVFQRSRTRMANVMRPILRFLDNMYTDKEMERVPQRQLAEQVKFVDVRSLSASQPAIFTTESTAASAQTIRVQYDAYISDIDRIKKALRKSRWSAAKIGKFTFEHYLKTECPE